MNNFCADGPSDGIVVLLRKERFASVMLAIVVGCVVVNSLSAR